jgi:hypothetical protein
MRPSCRGRLINMLESFDGILQKLHDLMGKRIVLYPKKTVTYNETQPTLTRFDGKGEVRCS